MATAEILVDPTVSRAKFERELVEYRKLETEHQRRGWWILKAEFPEVFTVFAAPQLRPSPVVFGALLDFTNYDLWPPSVQVVDPFTREPYSGHNLPVPFLRRVPQAAVMSEEQPNDGRIPVQQLMQFHQPDQVPFLCLPGVREYHQHPAHTGDLWLLHRNRGEGTLFFILDKLYTYGVAPLGYNLGYRITDVPE